MITIEQFRHLARDLKEKEAVLKTPARGRPFTIDAVDSGGITFLTSGDGPYRVTNKVLDAAIVKFNATGSYATAIYSEQRCPSYVLPMFEMLANRSEGPKLDPLARTLIEKAGYANGWENVASSTPEVVVMFSSRHGFEARVTASIGGVSVWEVAFPKGPPFAELVVAFSSVEGAERFGVSDEASLGKVLRRAAELAESLPNFGAETFAKKTSEGEMDMPSATEIRRMVKQRIGQDVFRAELLKYWEGACAVTGLDLLSVLRASHAKPWAECSTDAERLNVFNGFLLAPHLDALFDAGFITFDDEGNLVISALLSIEQAVLLAIPHGGLPKLRWIRPEHRPFLVWHRKYKFKGYCDP